jgi:iron complex outermembrane receptor protein
MDSSSNEPIIGATVSDKNGLVGLTDAEGVLKIKNRSILEMITISAIGYRSLTTAVSKNTPNIFKLSIRIAVMDPIEIKTVRAGEKYPFTQSIIKKREIEKKNLGQDLPFLLDQIPGTVVNSDAGNGIGYTGIRIRGSDPTRVNITLNGIPYNDAESQGVFFVNIPDIVSSANSIQIQRGVGTSSNGTGAFGSTINILTNEVIPEAYGAINNSFGSFNSIKNTLKAGTGLINNRFTIDLRLSSIKSDGYIERASSDLKSFYVSAASIKEKSSLRFNLFSGKEKTYQAWYGIPEDKLQLNRRLNIAGTEKADTPYDNETDNYGQTHYQLFYNKKINSHFSINNSTYITDGSGYYEQYKEEQKYKSYGLAAPTINGTVIEKTDLIRQLWLKNRLIGNNVTVEYKKEKKEILIGVGTNRYEGNHFGKVIWANYMIPKDHKWYDLDAKKTEQFVFGKWLQKINPKTNLFADLQLRTINYNINGFRGNPTLKINNNWTFLNPKFGFRKEMGKYNLFASYAMANKEPNRDDFEAGLSSIPKPESLHDIELGMEKKSDKKSLSVTAYYMRYRNQLVITGKINDVGAYTRTNIPNSYRLGIEMDGTYEVKKWLTISGNLAISENKILSYTDYYDDYDQGVQVSVFYPKTKISFSPSVVGSSTVLAKIKSGFQASLISKYVGRQFLDNTSRVDRSLDPYFVQDLQINYQIKIKHLKTAELMFKLINIWNKDYEPNGYTYSYKYEGEIYRNNYYYPMATRNWMIGLNIGF